MARKLKVGIEITVMDKVGAPFTEQLEVAQLADEIGLDFLAVPDSMARPFYKLDALIQAAALFMKTKRIRVGTDVFQVPLRHPIDTARRVATLDRISEGRFDFGVGLGWVQKEFEILGIPFNQRAGRADEALQVIKRLWTEPVVSHEGKYFKFSNFSLEPKPVQRPHPPIWIGGSSDAALRRVVRIGDGWAGHLETGHVGMDHLEGEVKTYGPAEVVGKLQDFAREAGRDFSTIHLSVMFRANINRDSKKAVVEASCYWDKVGQYIEGGRPFDVKQRAALYGPPEILVDKAMEVEKLGAERVVFYLHAFDIKGQVKALEKYVLPRL